MKTIGIVMRLEAFENTYKWFINESYVNALNRLHVAIYPICNYTSLQQATTICDGLIVPGGYDIHAYYLKEVQHPQATLYTREMDHFDLACIDAFIKLDKAILGICRGMQMLNVYFQGTLKQDIETSKHTLDHTHLLCIQKRSFLEQLYPMKTLVNSYHHQIVDQLGSDLSIAALSEDGYIEAFEQVKQGVIAVQWHPEKMEDDQVFPYFIDILCFAA